MNRTRFALPAALVAAFAMPGVAAARALDDPFTGLETVARAELGDMRGGMMVNGIPVNFAVIIQTTVQGALEANGLRTTLTVDDAGGLAGASTQAVGSQAAMIGDGDGVSMTLADGGTSILHQVIDGHVQAVIANSADAVSISHQTQVNVTMPGFTQTAQTYFAHSHVSRLGLESAFVGLGRF